MRIRIVTPIITEGFRSSEDIDALRRADDGDLEFSHAVLETGPASIECEFDEALAAPGTIARIVEAERDGVDAVVVDCFGDPGVAAAREMVRLPVIGAGQASMHLAAMLGQRFSIITTLERVSDLNEREARAYGVGHLLASSRPIDLPVLELERDLDRLITDATAAAVSAIEQDGAHVIVFGCTGMARVARGVSSELAARGYPIPVVEPLATGVAFAVLLLRLGLSFSPLTYPAPPIKRVKGYPFGTARGSKGATLAI